MWILGLDPGSIRTGFGVIEKRGSRLRAVHYGCFACPPAQPVPGRLALLVEQLQGLLERYPPQLAVLETAFHGRSSRSLIVLAQARGALLATLAGRGIEIREHSPAEIKSALTGNGRAPKEQVGRMVRMLLGLHDPALAAKASNDVTDALAVAICCAQRLRLDRLGEAGRSSRKVL